MKGISQTKKKQFLLPQTKSSTQIKSSDDDNNNNINSKTNGRSQMILLLPRVAGWLAGCVFKRPRTELIRNKLSKRQKEQNDGKKKKLKK